MRKVAASCVRVRDGIDESKQQEVADKLTALEGHAGKIVYMVIADGKEAAMAFIDAEYAKVVAALGA